MEEGGGKRVLDRAESKGESFSGGKWKKEERERETGMGNKTGPYRRMDAETRASAE